jgi:hypothetical protein
MKSKTVNYSNKYKFVRKFLANLKIEKGTAIINNVSYNLVGCQRWIRQNKLENSARFDRKN